MKNKSFDFNIRDFVIGFIILIIATIGCVYIYKKVEHHNNLLREEARQKELEEQTEKFVHSLAHSGKISPEEKPGEIALDDAWGNRLKYDNIIAENQITHIVISAGRDGQFDTADDILGKDVDTNYSKIIGRTIMDQAVEFGKGLKEGWGHKNQFEKTDEQRK